MIAQSTETTATKSSLIALAQKLFGERNVADWAATLTAHYQNDPPFTKAETLLREKRQLTPRQGGKTLLEFALDETFRGILGTRKGARRKQSLVLGRLSGLLYTDARLVIEPPANAVTVFRGERIETRVDGIIGINCTVFRSKGVPYRKVRCRFVSHPFWQLGVSNIEERLTGPESAASQPMGSRVRPLNFYPDADKEREVLRRKKNPTLQRQDRSRIGLAK